MSQVAFAAAPKSAGNALPVAATVVAFGVDALCARASDEGAAIATAAPAAKNIKALAVDVMTNSTFKIRVPQIRKTKRVLSLIRQVKLNQLPVNAASAK
ncbi:MAG: hypothetical protein K2Q32_00780 [Alphaproteobacteria bacterium]|nr:hypothetical protein [Alphaproteobacteria bacterium]